MGGLISLEDCVELECEILAKYIQQSNEILLEAVKRQGVLKESSEENLKENIERRRTGDYQAKQLVQVRELKERIYRHYVGCGENGKKPLVTL